MARKALMKRNLRPVFWVESALAFLTAFLAILTLIWRDWIELVFGFDPDHHNGSFEWELVIACCAATILCSALAHHEWRRASSRLSSSLT
jgi:hypothetical protein